MSTERNGLLNAHAKINLTLEIDGRDKWSNHPLHKLISIMQTISIQDTLTACTGVKEPSVVNTAICDEYELGGLAMEVMKRFCPNPAPVEIEIEKEIPIAAGLGGGSADAAAVMRYLNRYWGLNYKLKELAGMGLSIGSDVPFMLHGGTAVVTGHGDCVEQIVPSAQFQILLHVPEFSIPEKTRRAFALLEPKHYTDGTKSRPLLSKLLAGKPPEDADLYNVFEHVVEKIAPGWSAIRDQIQGIINSPVHLSGAGPAMFALTPSREIGYEWRNLLRSNGIDAELAQAVEGNGRAVNYVRQ